MNVIILIDVIYITSTLVAPIDLIIYAPTMSLIISISVVITLIYVVMISIVFIVTFIFYFSYCPRLLFALLQRS